MTDERETIRQLRDPALREAAFERLVREYQQPLYWQIRRMALLHEDADDILQNALLKAWSGLDSFRGEAKLSTWLFRIAINEAINFLEKKRRLPAAAAAEDGVADTLMSDPYFDGDQTQAQLQEAVSRLPERQRAVFNLKYFQEMKYEEMSQVLGTSVGSLKASYHHAVRKITAYFERRG